MKIYLSRWVCLDVESNLRRVGEESEKAVAEGAEMVLFPESFLHGYKRHLEPARVRERFAEISSSNPQTAFVFGSFSEERKNRMTVWLDGREAARYDKVHLFAPNGEFDIWAPGDRYAAFTWKDRTWGMVVCNDIRFPEQTRALKLQARCDAFIVVGWWPWRRDHVWRTLLRARAIENAAWTIACCLSASESPEEQFAGAGNHVFDPLGNPVYPADDTIYDINFDLKEGVVVDPLKYVVNIGAVVTIALD
jgi:predicted amidohydrolase